MTHYYDKKQTSKLKIRQIKSIMRDHLFSFRTGSGVFSIKGVDAGTKLLVNSCIIDDKWTVLDLGCGYGVVGIALKKVKPSMDVFMVDVNERAVTLAEKNAELNDVKPHIVKGHLFEPFNKMLFNSIIVNPPYVAGKKFIYNMIEESKRHLVHSGLLQMVAKHQKGGKAISAKMEEVFGNVEDIARESGYHVYMSRKTHGKETSD